MSHPPVICIVGPSGSGKTALIEVLVSRLTERGYSVGTVKHHDHGDFQIDHEGKDTWRHARAGARSVSISSPSMFALIRKVSLELDLDEIAGYMEDMDVILAEGYTRSFKPRIIITARAGDVAHFGRGREIVEIVDDPSNMDQVERVIETIEAIIKSGSV